MADIPIIISVTQKEFEALSFYRHEISDKLESSEDLTFTASMERHLGYYNEFKERLFASKSKKVNITKNEFNSFLEFYYEANGKVEQFSDPDNPYLLDINYHNKRFNNLRKKYNAEKNDATVKWALNLAKQNNL